MGDDGFWMRALAEAEAADAADPLARFRGRFRLPTGVIYLDGNSLGPAPEAALRAAAEAAEREWADGLIRSWNTAGWFELPTRLGDLIAPVIGAGPGEVVVSDTTTINIHKALHAGLSLRPGGGWWSPRRGASRPTSMPPRASATACACGSRASTRRRSRR